MSNIYITQPVRKKHGISWEEEYILGLIDHAEEVRVSAILGIANEVMTPATAHKYLTQLLDKKYVKHVVGADKRVKVVELTKVGNKFLDELTNDSLSMS